MLWFMNFSYSGNNEEINYKNPCLS